MAIERLRCVCSHQKGQHELSKDRCTNCDCRAFVLDKSITEAPAPSTVKVEGKIPNSGLKDSGTRKEFASGMVRDTAEDKPRFDLVIPEGIPYEELMLTRWAELLRKGAVKYSERNWEKADGEEELIHAKASAFRHFMQWFSGETDEDHAAAVFFNINEVETIKYKQKAGS